MTRAILSSFLVFSLIFVAMSSEAYAAEESEAPYSSFIEESNSSGVEVTVPENQEEAQVAFDLMIEAARSGNWSLFAGILLTLLIWFIDRVVNLRSRVGKKALPWVAAGLGIAATVAASLGSGLVWWEALIQGFVSGATAVGLWEMLLKHFLHGPKENQED